MGKYIPRKPFVSRTSSPRVDVIPYTANMTPSECTDFLVGEYDYTGHETENQHKFSHSTEVEKWALKMSTPERLKAMCEITEANGNHVKWHCKLASSDQHCQPGIIEHFGSVGFRLLLYATMKPKPKTQRVTSTSKKAKTHHDPDCYYVKRIKETTTDIGDRRACRICGGN